VVTEAPRPLDAALDLFVYVPVGLAMTAVEELPKLAAKGRSRVGTQMMMARVVGQFAVTRGRQEIEKRFSPVPPPSSPVAAPGGAGPVDDDGPAVSFDEMTNASSNGQASAMSNGQASATTNGSGPGAGGDGLPGADTVDAGADVIVSIAGDLGGAPAAPGAPELAIPGYDSLSASQVVQRLAGLSRHELDAVGLYEQAHRGRRTIINRIQQLQGL
jgi:hypothetical protein